jgi:hypothetical protein
VPPQKYIDPMQIVIMAVESLESKFKDILTAIKNETQQTHNFSDKVTIAETQNVTKYTITGETYSVGYLLTYYCYNIDKSVSKCNCVAPDHSYGPIIVTIGHPEPTKLIIMAINKILTILPEIKAGLVEV